MKKLPTIAMTPMPEFGYYDPIKQILDGDKKQTLRKQRNHWNKEVTVGGKRTGIVVCFGTCVEMTQAEFLTDEFARADGFTNPYPACDLEDLLRHFYGEVPETMWCCPFAVVQRPKEVSQ